jgi:hypothetical protein
MSVFIGNVQIKNLNAQQGFHPRRFVLPPNAIPPEQVIRHNRSKRRDGKGGQALSPPLSYQCFLFHTLIKGILQSQFFLKMSL